jgi:hypothetical protein
MRSSGVRARAHEGEATGGATASSAWRDGTPARARVNVLEERRSAWGSAPYSGARGLYMYGIRLSRARLMVIHRLCHLSLVDDLDGLFSMTRPVGNPPECACVANLSFAISERAASSRGRRPTAPPSVRRGTQVAAVRASESPRATRDHPAAPGAAGSDRCRRCVLPSPQSVSSEPYLRRRGGMRVIPGDVAIKTRASGSSWRSRAYPLLTKRLTPGALDTPPVC